MKLSTNWRVVLDTNVFISSEFYKGICRKVIECWLDKKVDLLISSPLYEEIIEVLKRLNCDEKRVTYHKEILIRKTIIITPTKAIKICRDPKDNKVLELCFKGEVDYLITGDKDLLIFKKYRKTKILTPKEFLLKMNN